ncbi:MAG TPA: helix-turn-helix domain-containing protein [Baekduia sp.]|uniref:helix-turn-helix domain-containing protein n=1 Tax=Baekduia sp. TaxID=2600305 RepID=UPI002C785687|nr:helix-turn-helix domain-containing protein [Baekduia sp.]HMJ36603.1 helix-turn-helix domain-containing protein [Baekduia sp.]
MSRQLDEVHARLAFAKRQLEREQGPGPPGDDVALTRERPEAPVRLVHVRGEAAVGERDVTGARPASPCPMLYALGRERGALRVTGRTIELSRRHTEILVLLATHPHGMTTEELAVALYGEAGRPASVRVELCRLRKIAPRIFTERNRVKLEVEADFLIVQRLLRAGRALAAVQGYPSALLPRSEAPGVVDARDELEAWVRSAVMTSDDPAALWAWLESGSGWDDALAWKRFLADLEFADPRRALAVSRLARLRNALTVVR